MLGEKMKKRRKDAKKKERGLIVELLKQSLIEEENVI